MKKLIIAVGFCINTLYSSQTISSSRWSDLFSYNNVLQIREGNGKIIAATENGIFYLNPETEEMTKLSKANGLHEVKISAFDYNPNTETALIGYANGALDIVTPEGITFVVDIPLISSFTGSRKINHISINGDLAVISVDYGVSIFNLKRKEFADTAFITNGVKKAIIKDNTVYAITNTGIKKHTIGATTFPILSYWNDVQNGDFNHISTNGNTIAIAGNSNILYGDGNSFSSIPASFSEIKDITLTSENILITEDQNISNYSTSGQYLGNLTTNTLLNSAWFYNNKLYAGSKTEGIINSEKKTLKPDGPYNNRAYKLHLKDNKIWVSTGARSGRYQEPEILSPQVGFYFFNGTQWIYPSYFLDQDIKSLNIMDAVPNPNNENEVFFSNLVTHSSKGFYKINLDDLNSTHYPTGDNIWYNRPVGLAYDDKNNLFATTYVYENGAETTAYAYYNPLKDEFQFKKLGNTGIQGAQKPIFYEHLLIIPTPRTPTLGVIDLKNTPSNLNDDEIQIINSSNGLIGEGVISTTIDNNGDAWVGTNSGLRIIPSIATTYKNPTAIPIIIEENGIGEELFRDSEILQIEVDGANNKWISVNGSGVFLLNPNGQRTIYKFTKENSPLPNNIITDIKVDTKTGKVYFATLDGIVTYQSDYTTTTENFGTVLVYPNPVVYSSYKGSVHIKGLAEKTNIRITDTAGNLVHQAIARGGKYEWDLTNKGKRVASGIYFVLMTNENGTDKATAKIAVVN